MELFSQRKCIKPIKNIVQVSSMDEHLRNGLWNALIINYWDTIQYYDLHHSFASNMKNLIRKLWVNYYKFPLDTLSYNWYDIRDKLRTDFFECEWYEVYDFIEFISNNFQNTKVNLKFMECSNIILERELSAYRFVGGKIAQITSEEEIYEIEEALKASKSTEPVAYHMRKALDLFSNKKSPDYQNSIKESISAVEAICKLITKNNSTKTLGDALKVMERGGILELHPALKKAFSSLYGYTNDAEGIRHALLDEPNLNFEDARFMLVSCSAFINYLKIKSSKAGIEL